MLFSSLSSAQSANDLLLFASGYLAGHVCHESGHFLVGSLQGVPVGLISGPQFPYVFYTLPGNLSPSQYRTIAAGGFVGELVSSEVILACSDLRQDDGSPNYFLLGMLAMTVVNPFVYTMRDYITLRDYRLPVPVAIPFPGNSTASLIAWRDAIVAQMNQQLQIRGATKGYGDLALLRRFHANTVLISSFLLAHAAVTTWRVYEKLSHTSSGVELSATPATITMEVHF
jgi:hypothetical protein